MIDIQRALALLLASAMIPAAVACGGGEQTTDQPDAALVDGTEDGVDEPSGSEAGAQDDGQAAGGDEQFAEAGDEPGTGAGAGVGDPEGADAEASAQPTPNATVVALAEAFEPPSKGDPEAPLILYDFSAYT